MENLTTEYNIKQAFRKAYEFMESHNKTLWVPEEFLKINHDMQAEYDKCGGDPLTMNLIMAVVEYVCDKSKNVARRTSEGS